MKSLKLNLSTAFAFLALAGTSVFFNACEKNTSPVEKIKDGLDMRENEKAKDAAEEVGEAVKETGENIKDAINKATN
jgi:phage-related minor tail protein